jgi:carbonic anhydrase/acetyltransferase-like protein (isoleucine patch superfamily)
MLRAFRSVLPKVHPTAYIDESAQVIGDVEIGRESSVWMNVVIRGDVNSIRIGDRTNIQDGTVIHVMRGTHATTIGSEVTVGHAAILHGCTIRDRVLIGMGSMLLNGADIGEESIVAAGTLVPEEKRFPSRSLLMGRPATVKRELTADEVATIRDYAERYVGNRKDYMSAGRIGE